MAIYILFSAVVSVAATSFLPDYTNRDISDEVAYARPTEQPARLQV